MMFIECMLFALCGSVATILAIVLMKVLREPRREESPYVPTRQDVELRDLVVTGNGVIKRRGGL